MPIRTSGTYKTSNALPSGGSFARTHTYTKKGKVSSRPKKFANNPPVGSNTKMTESTVFNKPDPIVANDGSRGKNMHSDPFAMDRPMLVAVVRKPIVFAPKPDVKPGLRTAIASKPTGPSKESTVSANGLKFGGGKVTNQAARGANHDVLGTQAQQSQTPPSDGARSTAHVQRFQASPKRQVPIMFSKDENSASAERVMPKIHKKFATGRVPSLAGVFAAVAAKKRDGNVRPPYHTMTPRPAGKQVPVNAPWASTAVAEPRTAAKPVTVRAPWASTDVAQPRPTPKPFTVNAPWASNVAAQPRPQTAPVA
jgi:hypothetical protein